ncbi:UNVERIFIED_CONTAM: hypothetical protein PYX00_001603 [Menopon gallinae]|uniref:t-SNARE coiled-coil homology domain-containing protein n=1 Tax=Menopon gallinae TaxID=328185 RepID=A0AAW2ID03_9NEOP
MSLEDPFFVVKDEVSKALNKTSGLYRRWLELQDDISHSISRDEVEWTSTELRNALRSIEWDLEDLEDTINILLYDAIVEKNPTKFKLDNKELSIRRNFIDGTKEEVKSMKDKMNINRVRDSDRTACQPLLERDLSPPRLPISHGTTKYSKLENELDSPNRHFLDDTLAQQSRMFLDQDEQLDMISDSVGTLKTVSRQIGNELDEQAVMLDDFGNELENIDSKLDSTMKKMAKVLHLSSDRRQWMAIGILLATLTVIVILFIVL